MPSIYQRRGIKKKYSEIWKYNLYVDNVKYHNEFHIILDHKILVKWSILKEFLHEKLNATQMAGFIPQCLPIISIKSHENMELLNLFCTLSSSIDLLI